MERTILHVDVNNAFLSWTAVYMLANGYNVDIRTIPSIIGGDEEKRSGIVLAKSPIAKKFGVVTGEPIYFAKQKCNSLQVFKGNFDIYRDFSDKLYKLLLEYTDKIERFSIDECFMDLTGFLIGKNPLDIAYEIKDRVQKLYGFTVNVGVSTNKLLAKMASDFEKPNKVHTLYPNEISEKMWCLPVSELFMIGKKTVPKLLNMQIKNIGDLAKTDKNLLIKKFGKHGILMWEYANGIDDSEVNNKVELPKSVGNSVTLPKDAQNKEEIHKIIVALAEQVTYRLRKYNLLANVVNIQLRTNQFHDYSHQKKLNYPSSNTKDIIEIANEILEQMNVTEPIRLIGLRVDNLEGKEDLQLSFFKPDEKQSNLDKTIDELKQKYGFTKITRAGKLDVNEVKYQEKKYKK